MREDVLPLGEHLTMVVYCDPATGEPVLIQVQNDMPPNNVVAQLTPDDANVLEKYASFASSYPELSPSVNLAHAWTRYKQQRKAGGDV